MVPPLIKKGDWIKFYMSGSYHIMKCFHSNPNVVWVEYPDGKILKLHKLRNKIEVVEEPKGEVGKEETTKKLLNNLKKKSLSSSTTAPTSTTSRSK